MAKKTNKSTKATTDKDSEPDGEHEQTEQTKDGNGAEEALDGDDPNTKENEDPEKPASEGDKDDAAEEHDDDDDAKSGVKDEDDDVDEPRVELRVEIRQDDDKVDDIKDEEELLMSTDTRELDNTDPKIAADLEYIKATEPSSRLEIALAGALSRKEFHVARLTDEISKLRAFISKRKQTYKRKRKDEGAPTRALSAYNIFVQDRFARLSKENEAALKSTDSGAQLKRVPPASLVASTGNAWKELPPEEKAKYEERAKADRKRYEDQMAQYQPPDKQANRKRNKTGYNMFFSAHVLRLKQSEMGVPSERGSVARLVGTAWKQLSMEEKQYYEREADKHNGMNPVEKDGDEDEEEEVKRQQQAVDPYAHMHAGHEMHMHGGMPPMHPMHQAPQHDPRHHGYAYPAHHMYGQPPYDYYGHHASSRHHQGRAQGYGQGYSAQGGHPYDQRGM
eukprot:Nitzschia sp. Nitz4//scaffold119_size111653//25937//27605//NITZ4_004182-RA/size111653-augustus-gene-0.221-mRNA-1//-1//CDS//3329533812//2916//frame0